MDIHQAKDLMQRYQTGNCNQSEIELVESWYSQLVETGEWHWGEGEKDALRQIIEGRIIQQLKGTQKKKSFYLLPGYRWLAAASVILLLGAFSYFLFFHKSTRPAPIAKVLNNEVKAPQSNKAMITLANGQKVYLDSVGNGALAIQGNVKLVKLANGRIAYQKNSTEATTIIEYNTLSNPRGSKVINMTLADGSSVWLNAASSITYPVSFLGDERKVSVTGETYFEVAHAASKPFVVNNGAMNVRVLGTHFNINAFRDDGKDIVITLLEGSVKVDIGNSTGLLTPGQQAVVDKGIKVVNDVDVNLVMAWKNGYFQFDNTSLQNVLKEVSRWYDVDVLYEGRNEPRQFVGEMQRDLSLSEVLRILQINKVHFKIEGKELRVLPD